MRRLFFALTVCILFWAFAPLAAQEPDQLEPHFTDEVEVLSVETPESVIPVGEEKVIYDDLIASMRIIVDQEKRVIRTTDGKVYPWLKSFDSVVIDSANDFHATLVYKGDIFFQSYDYAHQRPTTYWTLNLATGFYKRRAADTVSTFCGDISPTILIKDWVIKIDKDEARLCSVYRQIISSPLPENYRWLNYDDPSIGVIVVSPDKNTLVLVGFFEIVNGYEQIFFRYDIQEDKVTKLDRGSLYHNTGIQVQWLTNDIVVLKTTNFGSYMPYDPILNLIDLRYNEVTIIKGAAPGTQEDQIKVNLDPLQIIVSDILSINLQVGDTFTQQTTCQDTVYDVLNRVQWQVHYGAFCHFVGVHQPGMGYALWNGQLWWFRNDETPTAYLVLDKQVQHVQLWGENLLIYTVDQVWQLDTTVDNATPELFFDHPALELVTSASTITPTNPFYYFITAEGLLRVNVKTDEQVLLFKGRISQVKWIDADRGFGALIYQVIEDNFPPYISPTIDDVNPFDQPAFGEGKLALVYLKTGNVIFETHIDWIKQRESYPGFWYNSEIKDLGHGWFQTEGSKTIYVISPEGKVVNMGEADNDFTPILRADDWILVQNSTDQALSLFNPATSETIQLATNISIASYNTRYEGNGEFTLSLSGKDYHIRVSRLVH